MSIIRELDAQNTHLAYKTLLELEPHLGSQEEFVRQVNQHLRPERYRLIGSFEDDIDTPVAIAGFRTLHSLAWSYYLYVDDMITRAAFRGRGHGTGLMQWLYEEAHRLGCIQVHIDSGVGAHRYNAHRLYLNQQMYISCYHFQHDL